MTVQVGVRAFRENLSVWLDRAAAGEEIVVTERGAPKVRIGAAETVLDRLVREGKLRRATGPRQPLPPPIAMDGSIAAYLEWARGGSWPGPEPDPADEAAGAG